MSFAVAIAPDRGGFCPPVPACGNVLASSALWQIHQASSRLTDSADVGGNDRARGVSSLCWGYRPVGRFIDGKSLDGLYWNNISCPPTSVKPSQLTPVTLCNSSWESHLSPQVTAWNSVDSSLLRRAFCQPDAWEHPVSH
jgi:hypothetical protein